MRVCALVMARINSVLRKSNRYAVLFQSHSKITSQRIQIAFGLLGQFLGLLFQSVNDLGSMNVALRRLTSRGGMTYVL